MLKIRSLDFDPCCCFYLPYDFWLWELQGTHLQLFPSRNRTASEFFFRNERFDYIKWIYG